MTHGGVNDSLNERMSRKRARFFADITSHTCPPISISTIYGCLKCDAAQAALAREYGIDGVLLLPLMVLPQPALESVSQRR
jgi:hypothetical protein